MSVRVALFTKTFLEPTHHAIASVLAALDDYEFVVFAKSFPSPLQTPNIRARVHCSPDVVDDLRARDCGLVHAIFDGDVALRAAGAARQLGLPAILSFHGGFDTKAKIRDPLYREITRQAAQDAARVTVVSRPDARRLREIGVTREVDVVRVPFDRRMLVEARRTGRELVAIGRLIEKKGFDVALRALALLPEPYSLTIVGDGPLRESWSALASELGIARRVQWRGALPLAECLDVLAGAFALVHPAAVGSDGNAEGTPQVVIWAQAMGIPVVCGDSGDLPELVADDATGICVARKEPEAFAAAVRTLESQERAQRLIDAARRAADAHSLDAVVEQWRAIYREAGRGVGA